LTIQKEEVFLTIQKRLFDSSARLCNCEIENRGIYFATILSHVPMFFFGWNVISQKRNEVMKNDETDDCCLLTKLGVKQNPCLCQKIDRICIWAWINEFFFLSQYSFSRGKWWS
jgi:hypothetical protein